MVKLKKFIKPTLVLLAVAAVGVVVFQYGPPVYRAKQRGLPLTTYLSKKTYNTDKAEVALDQPMLDSQFIIQWATQAVTDTFNFNFENYRPKLSEATLSYFTSKGRDGFYYALNDANILEAVKTRELTAQLRLEDTMHMSKQYVNEQGVYIWQVWAPIYLEFVGRQAPEPIHTNLILTIVRTPIHDTPYGIGIEQWITVSSETMPPN